jgi:Tfp pilus assembly protein PilO
MSMRRVAAIAAGISVALVVLCYLALWHPQSHSLAVAHQARTAAEQQIAPLNAQVSQLQVLLRALPSDTARLQSLETAVPNNPSFDSALDQLHQVAVSAGVILTAVGPSTPAGAGGLSAPESVATPGTPAITLSMSATGSYAQIVAFLTGLAGMPRTVVVDHVALSEGVQSSVTISARIFYAGSPTP